MVQIHLFGRFSIERDGKTVRVFDSGKAEELLCYLLVHRDRFHPRETLATVLWGDCCTTDQARKYLRNALWRLQTSLNDDEELAGSNALLVEPEWIQFRTSSSLWIDVMVFEDAYHAVKGASGYALPHEAARDLETAASLYRGNLIENRYQDWCLCERERLHQIYLIMLDKLMAYCEANRRIEDGVAFGRQILQHDRAREHTHRHLMRLHVLAGDRTGALRQYDICREALEKELDVRPSERTTALYEQIKTSGIADASGDAHPLPLQPQGLREVLMRLHDLKVGLADVERQVRHVEQAASHSAGSDDGKSRRSS